MICDTSRVMIAGSGSGCGKTTVTCALLAALKKRGAAVAAFKCGPDYIDPMFHSEILETKSRNLDAYLCGEENVRYLFAAGSRDMDIAVIEGVMGIYDGMGFGDDSYSANHIARLTASPEILVVDAGGKGLSLAAEIKGYLSFLDNRIGGIVINNCSERMYAVYRDMLKDRLGIKCYGHMPFIKGAEIGSRHLGLITAEEITDLREKMDMLGSAAEKTLDIDGILDLAAAAEPMAYRELELPAAGGEAVRIGIARDRAFCFYYEDSLLLLEKCGAELVPFSPLADSEIPENIGGLILGGGYPELYLEQLAGNRSMLASVKAAAADGMPVYAECGGFMYLGKTIADGDAKYPMAAVVPAAFQLTDRLVRFGYKELTAREDNLLCSKGQRIRCHEFHYSDADDRGSGFTAVNGRGLKDETIHAGENMYAGYPHLHLWGNTDFAVRFVKKCRAYGENAGRSKWR